MAHISGNGTSKNDMYLVDDYDSFIEAITSSGSSPFYIGFPEVYNGPKVIDLRSRGWITSATKFTRETTYVYFNGWTILGASIKNTRWLTNYDNYKYVTINDLIVKNLYILGIESSSYGFANQSRGGTLVFNRCKFSCCTDSLYSHTSLFYCTDGSVTYNQCSFNVKFNEGANSSDLAYNDGHPSSSIFINCIINITNIKNTSSEMQNSGNLSDVWSTINGRFQFCKITGLVRRIVPQSSSQTNMFISFDSLSAYNVVEVESNTTQPLQIRSSQNGTICAIYNKDLLANHTDGGSSVAVRALTAAQMVDQDYLNSIDFICGDPPESTTPPHKRRLIFNTHLHERRCA